MPTEKTYQKVVASFIELLETHRIEEITYSAIADNASVKIEVVRACCNGKLDLLAAFMREIDQKVLKERDPDLMDETPRDRLFDVLMCRLDLMEPHREAIRNLRRTVVKDPALAMHMHKLVTRSMKWMLVAAGIEEFGLRNVGMSNALALGFEQLVRVWLEDDAPGHPKVMVAVDDMLANGEKWMGRACRVEKVAAPFIEGLGRLCQRPLRPKGQSTPPSAAANGGAEASP
ncbi:TetR family transcriptional regulator [Pseudovibrio denitrificans]|uniref:TetR family transcriptional regulator n=1 Tax=Pseudovibrio denitrificans TaxID=258256 RepID=UPI0039BF18D7